MRRLAMHAAAGSIFLLAGCEDAAEVPASGPLQVSPAFTTAVTVYEGVHAPPQVKAGQDFQLSFTLRNTSASAVGFAEVALAWLRPDGSHAVDAGHWVNITLPAGGTWDANVIKAVAPGSALGTWTAYARGRLPGGGWFNLGAAGGVNPKTFNVIASGAFAATVSSVNTLPSTVAPGRWPQITATVRNTSTSDTEWGGHATFRIRAIVRRNGVVLKQQEWPSEPFAYGEARTGFAVAPDFDTSVTGTYDVEYTVRSGDGVHLLGTRRVQFWVERPVAQAACAVPPESNNWVSYASFTSPPFGFKAATPWLSAVHDRTRTGTSTVEVDYIRLWGRVGGVDRIISANEYDDGIAEGQLAPREPWYGGPNGWQLTTRMPRVVTVGTMVIRPSDHPDRVWHPYLELFPRADLTGVSSVRMEVRYRISGPALVQAGLDYWQRVDGTSANGARNQEAAVTDWNCTTGTWQTVLLERSTEVSAPIGVTTVPAGLPMRVGTPLRGTFNVRNYDDDTIRMESMGIETRKVVNGDPYCDPWVSTHTWAFDWTGPLTLAPGATYSHSDDWVPDVAGTYCMTVVEKRVNTPPDQYPRTFYWQNHIRITVSP